MSEIYERKTIKLSGSSAVILPIGWIRKQRQRLGIPKNQEMLLIIETGEDKVIITPIKKVESNGS